jgi:hypothetical protein
MINLSVICPDLAVRITRVETTEEFMSLYGSAEESWDAPFVFLEDEREGYNMCFNMERVRQLHGESWLGKHVDCEVMVEGFIIRQLARLR